MDRCFLFVLVDVVGIISMRARAIDSIDFDEAGEFLLAELRMLLLVAA